MKERVVLFVDDEINVLNALQRGLMEENYKSIFVTSGEKAIEVLEEREICVLVTDMRMPLMNGLDLMKIVKERYPHIVKIVLTGYTQLPQILATINQVDVFKFITKPWRMEEEFIYIIRQAVEYYELKEESKLRNDSIEKKNQLYQTMLKSIESKMKGLDTDIKNIKTINGMLLEHMRDTQNKAEFLKTYEIIFNDYIDTIPDSHESFKLDRLKRSLEDYSRKNNFTSKLAFNWQVDLSRKVKHKYQTINWLITAIIQSSIAYQDGAELTINNHHNKPDSEFSVLIEIFIKPRAELISERNRVDYRFIQSLVSKIAYIEGIKLESNDEIMGISL